MTKHNKRICLRLMLALLVLFCTSGQAFAVSAPKKIKIKTSAKTIYVGEKARISVKSVSPKKASKKVVFKSSNKSVATISKKGVVKGCKAGKVKITVYSKYRKKVKATVTITVKNKSIPETVPETVPETLPDMFPDTHLVTWEELLKDGEEEHPLYTLLDIRSTKAYGSGHILRAGTAPMETSGAETVEDGTAIEHMKSYLSSHRIEGRVALIGDGNEAAILLAQKALIKEGISNDAIYVVEGGMNRFSNNERLVTVQTSKAGMDYNCVSCVKLHEDLQSETPVYTNLVDAREENDFNIFHIKGSTSVVIMKYNTTWTVNKNRVKNYMAGKNVNEIYLVLCGASEEYTDAATVLLMENGVPAENIVRVQGGLSTYEKLYPQDIVYSGGY